MPAELIREMRQGELSLAIDWASQEGWNPGQYDAQAYYAFDPSGFLLLLLDNEPVGSISVVKHSDTFVFIGLFIVLPKWRGQGYGKKLWSAAMQRVAEYASTGLYAVPQQLGRYGRSGFFAQSQNHRWKRQQSRPENCAHLLDRAQNPHVMFKKLVEYDRVKWGFSREKFFQAILMHRHVHAFVTLDPRTREVNGFGVVQPCVKGFRIGPVYAESLKDAKTITRLLIAKLPEDTEIIFDIPSINQFSAAFAEFFGLERDPALDTHAMFKGAPHNGNEAQCYARLRLEIG